MASLRLPPYLNTESPPMNFRARLSLFALEARENPSDLPLDPYGGPAPAPNPNDPGIVAPPPVAPPPTGTTTTSVPPASDPNAGPMMPPPPPSAPGTPP